MSWIIPKLMALSRISFRIRIKYIRNFNRQIPIRVISNYYFLLKTVVKFYYIKKYLLRVRSGSLTSWKARPWKKIVSNPHHWWELCLSDKGDGDDGENATFLVVLSKVVIEVLQISQLLDILLAGGRLVHVEGVQFIGLLQGRGPLKNGILVRSTVRQWIFGKA